ncbi:hypothetical protein [Capillimicrobium parvum]|uniref:DUF2530 domain-containing protein n=1 Tax=Capillimicrobium parvum TaxID=2884022 RepID=A0A9E7C0Z0_9ACTN|nr:hypothetical protein [Capillimicrobium parvum]UGS36119.1 hypothetical protein DSM104329_02519 [Capillimicrobium parvum]
MGEPELPARFTPRAPASRGRRAALYLAAPVVWVVALVTLAFVVGHGDAVEYALIALGASFVVALLVVGWSRVVRVREERGA